ncbi:MAG: carbohydrate ABC transporter permease [Bacillota bacterium]|uniref:carbohydrate ABC transporter permease n=1 Tax=[Clostridium] aminophilum TaxID=1526 RepID=UPI0026F18763|nr:carbohydrate ABC transporter permease [[Clostridium] aminophilum]MDD6195493.1 carbohydrate ABC transporter permease [[Clostridium] aminophilum]MDT3843126.1 carbohydrate ABC transporter permease [Bacillota bacterium]
MANTMVAVDPQGHEFSVKKKNKKHTAGWWAQTVAAVVITVIMLFPLYWMISTSFKSAEEVQLPFPTLFPRSFHPENYGYVLQKANFLKYYWNTIVMTAGILISQVVTGILAAYGFARGHFRFRDGFFYVVLGALMIPLQVTFIPIYIMCSGWTMNDTYLGLILPEAVSAYYIFMLRNSFMSIDQSYIDAGRIDGLGRLGCIWYVLVPMSKASIYTITLVTFTNGWNAYFWPKIIAGNEVRRVLTVGLAYLKNTFAGQAVSNYHQIMAGAVLAILPVVILFFIFQKYMMTGYSKAAMK